MLLKVPEIILKKAFMIKLLLQKDPSNREKETHKTTIWILKAKTIKKL